MPDDPNKRGKQDRSRVSKQEHEQKYQKRKSAGGNSGRSGSSSGRSSSSSGRSSSSTSGRSSNRTSTRKAA